MKIRLRLITTEERQSGLGKHYLAVGSHLSSRGFRPAVLEWSADHEDGFPSWQPVEVVE